MPLATAADLFRPKDQRANLEGQLKRASAPPDEEGGAFIREFYYRPDMDTKIHSAAKALANFLNLDGVDSREIDKGTMRSVRLSLPGLVARLLLHAKFTEFHGIDSELSSIAKLLRATASNIKKSLETETKKGAGFTGDDGIAAIKKEYTKTGVESFSIESVLSNREFFLNLDNWAQLPLEDSEANTNIAEKKGFANFSACINILSMALVDIACQDSTSASFARHAKEEGRPFVEIARQGIRDISLKLEEIFSKILKPEEASS